MADLNSVNELSAEVIDEAVSWRRSLHQQPELAYRENKTSTFVAEQLRRFGYQVHRGLGGTGVVGTLARGGSRRVIGIRADMDALPIQELNDAAYASSTAGVMHACGHDGHVAIALAAARVCAKLADLDGTVHFIFQPAEENEGGARRMVEDGLFRLFPCDSVYALHNWPALPLGVCVARDGAMMAALAVFEITITGRGGHGAMPHRSTDPIIAACQLVTALQSIVSRNLDPQDAAVVSATQITAGDTYNVIPDRCVIRGTTRWFDGKVGDVLERRVGELAIAMGAAFGCEVSVRYERRFHATINHPAAAAFVRSVVGNTAVDFKLQDALPSMASEDFGFMLKEVPGCYFWLGSARSGNDYDLHSPRYDFNDDLIPLGAALWIALVRSSLSRQ